MAVSNLNIATDDLHGIGQGLLFCSFWGTVCKTVRPMLSDRCLSVLSATLVYCGQTVGWITMELGMQVGLGPGHIVLDWESAPLPQRGSALPIFGPYLLWTNS